MATYVYSHTLLDGKNPIIRQAMIVRSMLPVITVFLSVLFATQPARIAVRMTRIPCTRYTMEVCASS